MWVNLNVVLKRLFRRVGAILWRILKWVASCLERLRSRESQPRSLSKVDDQKSEKVIKRAALFVVLGVSQIDTHLSCPIQSYSNQSKVMDESFTDHNKSLTGNQVSNLSDSPEAGGYVFDNVDNKEVPR